MNEKQDLPEQNYNSLENVKNVDNSVVNTPAKAPVDIKQSIPDTSLENYLQLNIPKSFKPSESVVIELDGKKVKVDDAPGDLGTKSEILNQLYGEDSAVEENNNGGAIFVFLVIIVCLGIFIMLNVRRSDYILNLEKEVDKLKKDRYRG